MLYLISQVLLLLALASAISGLIGWLIRAFQSDKSERSLKRRLQSSQNAANYEIDRRENDIHRLRRKIAEIDSDPGNFRQGDFANLNGQNPEEHANDLVRERAMSGNSHFRAKDFVNGIPVSEADQQQAIELLNTRSEDSDGKYRADDFEGDHPYTRAELSAANQLAALRSAPVIHYRDGDFIHGAPRNPEEQHYADHIQQLRDENKEEREAAKEYRRVLGLELDRATEGLENAQREAVGLQDQVSQNDEAQNNVAALEQALANAHDVIKQQERQTAELISQIGAIDNDPQNFREGDLDGNSPTHHYQQRVNSGNTGFRSADFANGKPHTEEEMQMAIDYMNNRDEDTDGKYRDGDFANGTPMTPAEKELSASIDAMRSELEKHYRDTDFEGEKPSSEEEIKLAAHIEVMRSKNKSKRKQAKQQRQDLVKQVKESTDKLETAQADIAKLQGQLVANEKAAVANEIDQQLSAANEAITRQEKRINELESGIKEIDNNPQNFRDGDLANLDGSSSDDRIANLHGQRVSSGNHGFRMVDFANGAPHSDEEKLRAIEYLNNRDEDTDGKYRDGDFANGTPMTEAEKELSASIDAMRSELEKHYRDTDFEGEKPATEEEIKLAAHIEVMRAKNKSKRKFAKQQRHDLVAQLKVSTDTLNEAREDIAQLQSKLDASPTTATVSNLESALEEANGVISRREQRIEKLENEIQNIDTDPNHFRIGDLEHLNGLTPLERSIEIAVARATSGNSQFRGKDFAGKVPLSDEEKKLAIEYLASRDEDTDGKYRQADFANGAPQSEADFKRATSFDGMRTVLEKLYRDTDFEGNTPQTEAEIELAGRIDSIRAKNKSYRSASKKQRKLLKQDLATATAEQKQAREAVAELESRMQGVTNTNDTLEEIIASLKKDILNVSTDKLTSAHADIARLQTQLDSNPKPEDVNELEGALSEANNVIDRRGQRIAELEAEIQNIDTDPNHFRIGDLEHLNGLTPLERAMEIAVARATSGNSKFRGKDFAGQVPLSDEEKKLAIEFLATRDEDTDGKYRQADFTNGVPSNAAEFQRAASIDGMRTVLEKLYRDEDFEGTHPQTEAEKQLASRIDSMREKNKAYRSASKKQRKQLKQDLANATEEQKQARTAVSEIESRLQGIATTNESLEDIIASLNEDINDKTALQNQAGKKAEELALVIDSLERDLTKANHDGHKKAGDLQRELQIAKDELNTANQETASTEQSLSAVKSTLSERTTDKEKLQEQYAHQKTELALANNQLSERKQEIVKLNAAKNSEIQELQFALKNQESDNARLERDLEQLKRDLHAAQDNSVDRAAQESIEIQKAAADARVRELEASLKEHANSSQTWEELKQELTLSLQTKDNDLQNANNQLSSLQDNLEEYAELDDALRNRIEVLESILAEQRHMAGKSMSSRIREIEAMLSAERRKVESLSIESSISDAKTQSAPVTRVVTSSKVSSFTSNKKS